VQGAKMIDFFD